MLYQDKFVSISEDRIIFQQYYFPTRKCKTVLFADIEEIRVENATILNGKWRIHGTGNFKTWFPRDNKRFKRDKIFFAKLRNQWIDIGFTVENSQQVEAIFKNKNLLGTE